jgi:hypothetical protein
VGTGDRPTTGIEGKGDKQDQLTPRTPNRKRDPASSINGLDSENLRSQHVANVHNLAVRLRQRGCSVHRINNEGLVARRVENPDFRPHDNVMASKAEDFSVIGRCHTKLTGEDISNAYVGDRVREGSPLQ